MGQGDLRPVQRMKERAVDISGVQAEVEHGGGSVTAAQGLDGQERREHEDERRQQPARAPRVEPTDADTAGSVALFEQQTRNQEAAQQEKEIDTEFAAERELVGVAADDGE